MEVLTMESSSPGTLWNPLPSSGVTSTYDCHAEISICVLKMPTQVPMLVPQVLCQTSRLFSPWFSSVGSYSDIRAFEGRILITFA